MYDIAGPIEVKGVKGYDNRMFIYDLMRLSPRDLNYVNKEGDSDKKYENFLLRNELVHNYMLYTKLNEIQKYREKKYKEYLENVEKKAKEQEEAAKEIEETKIYDESKSTDINESKENLNTEGSKIEVQDGQKEIDEKLKENLLINDQEKEGEFVEKMMSEFNLKLNPSLHTSFEPYYDLEKPEDVAKKAGEIEDLKKLAKFLDEYSINKFVHDWHNTKPFASDNKDITTMLHTYGINLRYLGKILTKTKEITFPN